MGKKFSSNKKNLGIAKHLWSEIEHTRELVAYLSGQDINVINKMPVDKLVDYLGYLLEESKKADLKLHWRHNKEIDEYINKVYAYQLKMNNVLHNKGKSNNPSNPDSKISEFLKILFGKLSMFASLDCYYASAITLANVNNPYKQKKEMQYRDEVYFSKEKDRKIEEKRMKYIKKNQEIVSNVLHKNFQNFASYLYTSSFSPGDIISDNIKEKDGNSLTKVKINLSEIATTSKEVGYV